MIIFQPHDSTYGSISQALREAKALVEMLEHAPFVYRLLTDMPAAVAGLCDTPDAPAVVIEYLEHHGRLMLIAQEGAIPADDKLAGML